MDDQLAKGYVKIATRMAIIKVPTKPKRHIRTRNPNSPWGNQGKLHAEGGLELILGEEEFARWMSRGGCSREKNSLYKTKET